MTTLPAIKQIFKLLTEYKCLPFEDSINFLLTCKYLYASRKWFGDRRPIYKYICQRKYKIRKVVKQTKHRIQQKKNRHKKATRKANKIYDSLHQTICADILKSLTRHPPYQLIRLYTHSWNFSFITHLSVKVDKQFLRILCRQSIKRRFLRDINDQVAIYYPKLLIKLTAKRRLDHLEMDLYLKKNIRPTTLAFASMPVRIHRN